MTPHATSGCRRCRKHILTSQEHKRLMPNVKFIDHTGSERDVTVAEGTTIMRAAVDNGVLGIIGDCGGSGVCATCHCYVGEAWLGHFPAPGESERLLLECVGEPRPNSRLGCQVTLDALCDGIVIHLPPTQV